MTFQTNILIIALVIFIISMGTIGVMLNASQSSVKYPPELSLCPDYWEAKPQKEVMGETNYDPRLICMPNPDLGKKGNIGTFVGKEYDFSSKKYNGPSANFEKCKWANSYDIFWGGITDMGNCNKLRA